MANSWFRLYSEFSHDPKVQMMSEAMQRRYIMIMCLRCSNDIVTLHETELAFHLRITDAELAETKALFIGKGFIDDKWNLLNWEKRQFKSDSSAARVSRHREKKKNACNADVTLQKRSSNALDTDTDTDTDTETPPLTPPPVGREAASAPLPVAPTHAGTVCGRIKSETGLASVNPSNPSLLALLENGVSADELVSASAEAVAKGKGFAYALAVAAGRRRDAANIANLPAARDSPKTAQHDHRCRHEENGQRCEHLGVKGKNGRWYCHEHKHELEVAA